MPNLSLGEWLVLMMVGILAVIGAISTTTLIWRKVRPEPAEAELSYAAVQTSWPQVGLWIASTLLWWVAFLQLLSPTGNPFFPWAGAFVLDLFAQWLHARQGVLQDESDGFPWNSLENGASFVIGGLLLWLRGYG